MKNANELTLTTKAVVDHGVARLYVGPLTEVVLWRDTRSNRMQHAQPGEYIMQDSDGYPRRYSAADFAVLFEAAPAPTAPTGGGYTSTATTLTVTWTDNLAADAVNVYSNGVFVLKVNGGIQSHLLTGLLPDSDFAIVLKAVNAYGQESGAFNVAGITQPVIPGNPVLTVLGATVINVKWTDADAAAGINIYRKAGAGAYAQVGTTKAAGTTEFNDTGLTTATLYTYKLTNVGAVGGLESAITAEVAATTS